MSVSFNLLCISAKSGQLQAYNAQCAFLIPRIHIRVHDIYVHICVHIYNMWSNDLGLVSSFSSFFFFMCVPVMPRPLPGSRTVIKNDLRIVDWPHKSPQVLMAYSVLAHMLPEKTFQEVIHLWIAAQQARLTVNFLIVG